MTVALTASFKLIYFPHLSRVSATLPSQMARPQLLQYFRGSLPVPLDEPYRLRQTTYTWHTFIAHRQMDRRTDRYCL